MSRLARKYRASIIAACIVDVALGLSIVVSIIAAENGLPSLVCPSEDSPSCVWIAPLQGNGHGWIVFNGPHAGDPQW